jgi:hypothetical protein
MTNVQDQTDYDNGQVIDAEVSEDQPIQQADLSGVKNQLNGQGGKK